MQMQESALPRLDEHALHTLFGSDERAVWRYRVLAALFHEGAPVRTVARRFDTTPETIRLLRTTFEASGELDALRSKRRGATGHLGRQSPLAQAVAAELARDPTASGGSVWRRVHTQLVAQGIDVPRRSIYRLVERLRPAPPTASPAPAPDELWPPALVPHLRAALPLLVIDPPLDLGRSTLAETLLPDEPHALARGRLLHTLLSTALDHLRPAPHIPPTDPSYRPYHVLVGEALQGFSRDELADALAIAPATYTRAKRHGLERLAELVVDAVHHQRQAERSPAVPSAPPLFGRGRELRTYAERLERDGSAIIWGIAGSGKTAIAATLAAQHQAQGVRVVWHACSGSGDAIMRNLLRTYGDPRSGAGLDTQALLDALHERCVRGGVLVLDDFDQIADDATTVVLMAMLRGLVQRQRLRLIVVTRLLPAWAEHQGWLPLGGLAADHARAWWNLLHGGVPHDADDWPVVYQQTLGYPALMQRRADDTHAVVPYLRDEVCGKLARGAQELLWQMLLSRQPVAQVACIDDAPAGQPTPHQELRRRGLITHSASSGCYHLHQLLQTHRSALGARTHGARALLLQLCHHAEREGSWLDAAAYALQAGVTIRAVHIVEAHVHDLVAQRQGEATRDLLKQALAHLPPGTELATVQAQLGIVHLALGAYAEAVVALRTALELSATFGDRLATGVPQRWSRLLADAYVHLGQWQHALTYAQQSMTGEYMISADVPVLDRCALTLLQYRIWLQAGHPQHARFWLADAQTQAQISGCAESAALVAYVEGVDAVRAGRFAHAAERLAGALARLRPAMQAGERLAVVTALTHCHMLRGEFDTARTLAQGFRYTLAALGHRSGVAQLALAQARCALAVDVVDEAHAMVRLAGTLLDDTNRVLRAERLLVQGWLAVHDQRLEQGVRCCVEAIATIAEPPLPALHAELTLSVALMCWQQGDITTATQHAEQMLRIAESAQLERYRVLALLLLAREATQRCAWDDVRVQLDAAASPCDDPLVLGLRQQITARWLTATGAPADAQHWYAHSAQTLQHVPALLRRWLAEDL